MIWNPLFDGYYGMRNTGDDLFCVVAAWGASRYWGARRVGFAASTLPTMPHLALSIVPRPVLKSKPPARGYLGSLLAQVYRLVSLNHYSGLVYGGGSVVTRVSASRRLLSQIMQVTGKHLAGIGLSVGPFETDIECDRAESYLRHFDFLALRDRTSYEQTQKMALSCQVVMAFDLAGLLPAIYGPPSEKKNTEVKVLGLGLGHKGRQYDPTKEEHIKDALIGLSRLEQICVRLYVFNGHASSADQELAQRMALALKPFCPVEIVPYSNDPGQTWHHVAGCDAFLGERLHSAVFAYMAGVPLAMILYHRKCLDLAAEIGLPPDYRFSAETLDPITLTQVLVELIRAPRVADLPPQEAEAKAELNFTSAPWCHVDARHSRIFKARSEAEYREG